jgi:hypothetical protein
MNEIIFSWAQGKVEMMGPSILHYQYCIIVLKRKSKPSRIGHMKINPVESEINRRGTCNTMLLVQTSQCQILG